MMLKILVSLRSTLQWLCWITTIVFSISYIYANVGYHKTVIIVIILLSLILHIWQMSMSTIIELAVYIHIYLEHNTYIFVTHRHEMLGRGIHIRSVVRRLFILKNSFTYTILCV